MEASAGRLSENILHFARVLRRAGLRVGPRQVLDAVEAVEAAGIGTREDFYWTLHATLVKRHDEDQIFRQAFHVFWRNPKLLDKMMSLMLPEIETPPGTTGEETSRRLAEALFGAAIGYSPSHLPRPRSCVCCCRREHLATKPAPRLWLLWRWRART